MFIVGRLIELSPIESEVSESHDALLKIRHKPQPYHLPRTLITAGNVSNVHRNSPNSYFDVGSAAAGTFFKNKSIFLLLGVLGF
jgi:hypothetical protein